MPKCLSFLFLPFFLLFSAGAVANAKCQQEIEGARKIAKALSERRLQETAWVYGFANPAFPTLIKVGWTKDVESRRLQLSGAAVPSEFTVIAKARVPLPTRVEKILHCIYADVRVSPGKEFFRLPQKEFSTLLDRLNSQPIEKVIDILVEESKR